VSAGRSVRRGLFVSFEGGEGSGKSTQLRLLAEAMRAEGRDVVATREPGGSPGAEAVRALLLDDRAPLVPMAELLLFAAARADHVQSVIAPALARRAIVLCDRFSDSTRAYQGGRPGIDDAAIETLRALAVGGTMPDVTLIFDVPADVGLRRAGARRGAGTGADRFEARDLRFHEGVRKRFLAIAAAEPERCRVIAADRPVETIAAEVRTLVAPLLARTAE